MVCLHLLVERKQEKENSSERIELKETDELRLNKERKEEKGENQDQK